METRLEGGAGGRGRGAVGDHRDRRRGGAPVPPRLRDRRARRARELRGDDATSSGSGSSRRRPRASAFARRLRAARAVPPPVLALLRTLPRGRAPPRRPAHGRLAGRHGRSRPSRRRRRGEPPQGAPAHDARSRRRRRLAAPPHGPRAGAGRHRGLARRPLPPPPARARTRARRRAGPRHDPHAPRGPRAQRLDVRGPRRGRHPGGPPRGAGRRDRHAQGAAPRRRQRGRAGHAAARSAIRTGPRRTSPPAWTPTRAARRAERADPRARIPGFGHRVYRVDDARARVLRQMAQTMAEATGHARLFEVAERVYAAMTARTALPGQRRLLLGGRVPRARYPGRPLHVDLRGRAGGRVVRPRARAVRGQPPHPSAGRLRRPAAARARSRPLARSERAGAMRESRGGRSRGRRER